MSRLRISLVAAALAGGLTLSGCSTWDSMSRADKGTAIGAGAGAAIGNATVGGAAGTVGGAVVGGAAGRYYGDRQDDEREARERAERERRR